MILALRAYADGKTPANDFERKAVAALQASGTDPVIAKNLVANFDRLTPSLRRRALGEFADPAFVPKPRSAGGPRSGSPRSLIGVPTAKDLTTVPEIALDPSNPAQTLLGYSINYVGFHCDEAVGDQYNYPNDWSEEVYAISSAVHISRDGPKVRTVKHPIDRVEYEDVDAGETRLGPIAECWRGIDLPMSLTVVAFERDYGDPDYYRDEIETAVTAAAVIAYFYWDLEREDIPILLKLRDLVTDVLNVIAGTEDDQVDIPRTAILDFALIERLGAQGRDRHIHRATNPWGQDFSFATPLLYHFATRHSGLGGRYTFGFDLERDPPFVETPGPPVD
jgi:hypothetical protein